VQLLMLSMLSSWTSVTSASCEADPYVQHATMRVYMTCVAAPSTTFRKIESGVCPFSTSLVSSVRPENCCTKGA